MAEFVENFPNGDGHFYECVECKATIGESSAMVFADGEPMHNHCFEDAS
jgi:hypothetical protein